MTISAMPPWIKDTSDGTNTDWNNGIQRYWKKSWFAYGPRAIEWWARWREYPRTLFAILGDGFTRFETETYERDSSSDIHVSTDGRWYILNHDFGPYYLSAIQYNLQWHFQIQWPLFVAGHFKITEKVIFYFRVGARRDADKVYWFPSFFMGLTWN